MDVIDATSVVYMGGTVQSWNPHYFADPRHETALRPAKHPLAVKRTTAVCSGPRTHVQSGYPADAYPATTAEQMPWIFKTWQGGGDLRVKHLRK